MAGFLLPLALGIGSGIANLLSGNAAYDAEQQRINATIGLLEQSIVNPDELAKILRSQSRMFNSRLQSVLNSTAIRSRGLANRGVVGAAASGQINATAAATAANTEERVLEMNKRIKAQEAVVRAGGQTYRDPIGSFFQGAIPGVTAGMELDKLTSHTTPTVGAGSAGLGLNPGSLGSYRTSGAPLDPGTYNPFMDNTTSPFGGTLNALPSSDPFDLLQLTRKGIFG